MINPTLFIGLGTTGLKILEYLQEMVLEQYGTTKLPIFEYIVIDVDERRRAETPLWGTNEIQVLYTPIRDTFALREAIHQGRRPYLEDWFDYKILNVPGSKFDHGAGLTRMAGRLCLWENWETCTQALVSARARITSVANIAATVNFLQSYYKKAEDV